MALGVHPAGRLLDYEQYIEHQMRRTRSRIKETDVLTAGLTLATAALAILFLEVLLDHAIGLPLWLRRAIAWSSLSGGGAYAVLRIALPLFARVNVFYAAKTIEDADPSFKNSLTTYLELRRRRGQVSRAAFEAVEARAVKDLVKVEIDAVIDRRRLLRPAYALTGLVVLFCLYAAATPRSILDSARRALLADVARPTRTRLVAVRPGDLRIVSGDDVPFSVDVRGTRPGLVTLHYSYSDSANGDDSFSTAALAPGPSESAPWQATLRGVRQDLDYYLTAGDARSRRHQIKVMPAPLITSVRVDLIAPPYTGILPRMDVEGDMIEAIEGTVVTVRARTNEPAVSAHFEFDLGEGRWDGNSAIEVSGTDARLLLGRFTVSHSGVYTIRFKSTGGRVNPDPAVSEIVAFRDRPPTVTFLHPAESDMTVPSNVKVPLVMTVDDDFGVKDALLTVRQGNETLSTVDLLEGRRPARRFAGAFTIDLAKASPGTAVEYWLSVRDTKEPIANRTDSRRRIIRVAGPVAPEERRAIEENAERDKAEAEKSGGMAKRANLPGDESPRPDRGGGAVDVPGERKDVAGAQPPPGNPGDDPPGTGDRPQLGPEQIARIEEILNAVRARDGRQTPRTSSQPGTGAGATTHPGPAPRQDAGGRHDWPPEPIASAVSGADPVADAPTNPSAESPHLPGAPGTRSDPAPGARANRPTSPGPNYGPDPGDDAPPDGNVEAVTPATRDAARSSDLRGGGPGTSNNPPAPISETKPPQPPGRTGGPRPQPGATNAGEPRPATRQTADPSATTGESGAKGTRDQERPGEVAGRARDKEDANRRSDQAGGKAPEGDRPTRTPGRARLSSGVARLKGREILPAAKTPGASARPRRRSTPAARSSNRPRKP